MCPILGLPGASKQSDLAVDILDYGRWIELDLNDPFQLKLLCYSLNCTQYEGI